MNTILYLSILLFAGFFVTRITKKLRLPNVTGYILAGVALGPYVLRVIPVDLIGQMDFVTDIALAFIAFGVGRYFKLSALRKSGGRIIVITICEALMAGVLITLSMIYLFHLSVSFSLLLGAIGCATAPASTIMTIRQYKAKGEFVNTILQVVALDDAIALIAFSVCTAVVQHPDGGGFDWRVVVVPLVANVCAILLGAAGGWVLSKIISDRRSQEHTLVLAAAVIMGLAGFCSMVNVSPLLTCMAAGTAYINLSNNKSLFKTLNRFTPPVLLLFFVLSGLRLNVPALKTAGLVGVSYFFIRIIGKYLGAFLGAAASKSSLEVRRYLGLALIPQAGVSIGLAVLGQRLLPPESGTMLSTIILSSAVLYEMVGPACAKLSLILAHVVDSPKKAGTAKAAEPEKGKKAVAVEKEKPEKSEKSKKKVEKKPALKPVKDIAPAVAGGRRRPA